MFSLGSILAAFDAVMQLIQKGKPAIDGLAALLKEHNITVRDEALQTMIVEAESELSKVQAEIDARAKSPVV